MAAFLQFAFFAAALVAAYFFWIRPILRSRPAFADFYATGRQLLGRSCANGSPASRASSPPPSAWRRPPSCI